MATHELKTWPAYFEAVWGDRKPFEIRKDDRGFAVGDVLNLREFDPAENVYTGREVNRRVTYMLHGGAFGVEPGFVVLGLTRVGPQ